MPLSKASLGPGFRSINFLLGSNAQGPRDWRKIMKSRSRINKVLLKGMATRTRPSLVLAVNLATLWFAYSVDGNEPEKNIIVFDVPGAQGTQAVAINPQGTITGNYFDSSGLGHGFLRARNGTFITFDPPGVTTAPGLNTAPWGINPAGTTAGWWYTNLGSNFFVHGFLRTPDGAFTTVDVPDASQTWVYDINATGTVAGNYNAGGGSAPDLFRGFIRDASGAITTFEAPGAGTGPGQGTFTAIATALNSEGAVTGNYLDASNVYHGYVRVPNGTISTFDVPGAGTGSGQGTSPAAINPEGSITGSYQDANNASHGFVRYPFAVIISFDIPGAANTFPGAISSSGIITGAYVDASGAYHGFFRYPLGAFTTFNVPGAGSGSGQGTFPNSFIPDGAQIVGYYIDAKNISHGFLIEGIHTPQ
jgi:hypothetical protein